MNGISNIFRGITGNYEIIRSLGALGVLAFILGANGFEAYEIFWRSVPFDLVAYCAAFPTGLGAAILAVSGGSSIKDRGVAVATTVQNTGALPAQPTQGANK